MTNNPATHDEAFRKFDRDHTGNAINARTDEMKKELEKETDRLRSEYVDKDAKEGSSER